MPLYDFECKDCGLPTERFFKMAECPECLDCPNCGGVQFKIITNGHGGIQREEPVWLDHSIRGSLQDLDEIRAGREKPIENRTDYKRFMKEHPNIVEKN